MRSILQLCLSRSRERTYAGNDLLRKRRRGAIQRRKGLDNWSRNLHSASGANAFAGEDFAYKRPTDMPLELPANDRLLHKPKIDTNKAVFC